MDLKTMREDDTGRMTEGPRTLSLLPACTEIVCALGVEHLLVGRSHVCDYPPDIQHLPVCCDARVNVDLPGDALNSEVDRILNEGLSLFEVDVKLVQELQPEVILTQAQCDVCAVSVELIEKTLGDKLAVKPRVISFSPNSLGDVWSGIKDVSRALGAEEAGADLAGACLQRVERITEKTCALAEKHRPSVACLEWFDPLMAAGNWVPELVELAGGLNLFGEAGRHSPWMNWEAVVEHDPEIMVLMPCGFDMERCEREWNGMRRLPGWERLRAVQQGKVYITDGSGFFNRPGPRLVDSLEILAEMMNPDEISFGHFNRSWKKAGKQ